MKKYWIGLFLCLMVGYNALAADTEIRTQIISKCSSFYIHNCMTSGPVMDSTIAQGNPGNAHEEFYLKFDLYALPKNISIKSAMIELFCEERFVADPQKCTLVYERITKAWEEIKITSNNKPKTSTSDIIKGSWPTPGKAHTINITSFVQGWQAGTFPNYGIWARSQMNGKGYAVFTSSNIFPNISVSKWKVNHTPKLIVKYTKK